MSQKVNPKFTVIEVGEAGTFLLPLPRSVLKVLGWKQGDELTIDIPTTYPDQLLITRKG